MPAIRSLLWIGPARHFEAGMVADAATLDVVWERDLERALALPLAGFDALVLDADGADEALRALARLRDENASPPVLVRLDAREDARRSALIAAGAADVVPREAADGAELLPALVERLASAPRQRERTRLSQPLRAPQRRRPPFPALLGESPAMLEVFELVACAARSRATVLIHGETGTGKELVAQAIHAASPRRAAAFVAVNCGAFPDTLLESELFGHLRGAFTGADRDKKGLFEEAHGGTLFLDEVSETSGPFQAKLLRALQEREIRPLGSTRSRRVDVRVIAATNRDLWGEARSGRFREDVYYRLAVFPIALPPLRERAGDLPLLADHFLALHAQDAKVRSALSREALDLLRAYRWPGNVRELGNEIQRALALAPPGETLTPAHFSPRLASVLEPVNSVVQPGETLRETLGRIEAWLIRRALDANGGRRSDTARRLAITREGLYKKMKRYGIE